MKKPQTGDEVLIVMENKKEQQGILLESHEAGIVLLKLKSGYNIGVKKRDIKNIKVLKKAQEEKEIFRAEEKS